jgi:glyoxylase-like metal-dependent hydrolase (beta-lactamase superfamily II)
MYALPMGRDRVVDWSDAKRTLTDRVTVLAGENNGAYPSGNSVVVRGSGEAALIDPSITVVKRGGANCHIDAVLTSHSHEDHMAGNGLFSGARVHAHHEDLLGVQSIDGLNEVYGLDADVWSEFEPTVLEDFSYVGRPDATGFADGHRFDLGGVTVEAVHLPGHTRGHSGFRISDGVFFCSDIDLTGFGPYYGDAWSDLDQFQASLAKIREEEALYYVTFHHKGVIEGRADFVKRVDAFTEVIERRHREMLAFLTEPHTIEEMVARRFVYRPTVQTPIADSVERRTAVLHLARMITRSEAVEVAPGRFRAA